MSVFDTISKAERWLDKLSESYEKKDQQEVADVLSALLITVRSIPDHLLEDFNQKFNLNIPLNERQFRMEFDKKSSGISKEFFIWFNKELKNIRMNSTYRILMDKRNLDIHRQSQKPEQIGISVNETISSFSHITIIPAGVTKEEMKIINEKKNAEIKEMAEKKHKERLEKYPTKVTTNLYFQDLPDTNVLEASKMFLDVMKSMVETAYAKFTK